LKKCNHHTLQNIHKGAVTKVSCSTAEALWLKNLRASAGIGLSFTTPLCLWNVNPILSIE